MNIEMKEIMFTNIVGIIMMILGLSILIFMAPILRKMERYIPPKSCLMTEVIGIYITLLGFTISMACVIKIIVINI